jgi:hypothetical protein
MLCASRTNNISCQTDRNIKFARFGEESSKEVLNIAAIRIINAKKKKDYCYVLRNFCHTWGKIFAHIKLKLALLLGVQKISYTKVLPGLVLGQLRS